MKMIEVSEDALNSIKAMAEQDAKDAEIGRKVRIMLSGGAFDLTDSPKFFMSNCIRMIQEQSESAMQTK